ncbi:MAG: 2Fe-2S iron-sulfur cluster-binding protein [Jannaschia sp.]
MQLAVTGTSHQVDLQQDTPLLRAPRDGLGIPASGTAAGSCSAPGLEHQVAHCGYCQSGQIIQALDLLGRNPDPTDAAIDAMMSGNLRRCATCPRIRAAIHSAATMIREV